MFAVTNLNGYFESANPAWTAVLGWTEDELRAAPIVDFVHPDDRDATMQTRFRGGDILRFENRYRTKTGVYRWLSWTGAPEGERIYAVARDITEDKLRAAELEAAQDQLRMSQKLEAMGQLTGGVAHDFNNLLMPITGALDLLRRRGLGGEREQRLIAGALQSAERAKTLVQRLLAFARRQPLQPRSVDLGELIRGMADLVASTSGPQIRVMIDLPDRLPAAKADPNQLEMALLNLSVNARDAMEDGGVLTISAGAETIEPGHPAKLRPGDYVRFSVSDTGVGMDEETLARAIEPFFSTKGIGKGTGLGLSMAHGLASQLGGALHISSRPGLGTKIDVWLPVSAEVAQAPDLAANGLGGRKTSGVALLVDDEELVRMSTADMLADLGFAVKEAASAEEALRLIDDGLEIDVLVTDHLMPGMTGVDLVRALHRRHPSAPALIISGYAETDSIAPDLLRLAKPFRQADLAATLAKAIPGRA
jgi:PAS domain S-box-containing protein